jgi:hypothetical protein
MLSIDLRKNLDMSFCGDNQTILLYVMLASDTPASFAQYLVSSPALLFISNFFAAKVK